MAIPKVMGIETEYGITVKNQPDFNPILSSLLLINSYETYRSSRIRWDYEAESPLRDARGFEYMEEKEAPSKEESRLINLILSNGARFYVDHAHPEYSSPETTNPRDCVIWDRAGERILDLARTRAEAVSPPEQRILIYKNNTDSKGNSYGTHENYLMDRKVPFARIVQHLMPFLVSRQIYTGAGKVGAENNVEHCDFQISQRADFLETEVGLETMHSRPIINTREEPHADPEKYRRLHVIVGDANMSEVANYLKVGTMAVALSMIEDDFIGQDLSLDSPVLAYRKVSRDLVCRETLRLKDGRSFTAVDIQREFLEMAHRYYRDREHEPWVDDVLARWASVLDRLARDPMSLDRELDWVIKRRLIETYMARHGLAWSDSRVAMIDLQYHDVRPGKGLFYKLEESDAVERLVTEDEISKAIYDPPKDTRAYFRGMCLQKYSDEVVSASWDSVIFDLKEGPLKKIFMLEPLRQTSPSLLPGLPERPGEESGPPAAPHGTTVLALRYRDGVVMAGDRQASEGYQVAHRRIEKIFKADDLSGVGIAGAAGPAMEMARLFQTELEHYEKVEGENLSLEGKANKLGQMIRMNLPLAMQGLVVVPIFAGFDEKAGVGRLFKYDVTGGRYEETDYFAQGSGGKDARDSLKKRFKREMSKDEAVRVSIEALMDAADEDLGTGGPDLQRGIYPTVRTITRSGFGDVPDDEVRRNCEAILAERGRL